VGVLGKSELGEIGWLVGCFWGGDKAERGEEKEERRRRRRRRRRGKGNGDREDSLAMKAIPLQINHDD